jgi:hypothetical protein
MSIDIATQDEDINWDYLSKTNRPLFCQKFFEELRLNRMDLVNKFYHENAFFEDPICSHTGIEEIKNYYQSIYAPVTYIEFKFSDINESDMNITLAWTMCFKSAKLKSGKLISVKGMSLIKFSTENNKVIYHRDYFDLGAMVYEHIPIFGSITQWIKNKLK